MTGGQLPIAQMSERELLYAIYTQQVETLRRIDTIETRLAQGDRKFEQHEREIGAALRLGNAATLQADAAARIAERNSGTIATLATRLDEVEEQLVIDGDDGKPVAVREVIIRNQRKALAAGALASVPGLVVMVVEIAQRVWP